MVTAFHRLAVWPHMCVSDDVAGHKEALVAALFNATFQVVRLIVHHVCAKLKQCDALTLIYVYLSTQMPVCVILAHQSLQHSDICILHHTVRLEAHCN